MIMRSVVMILVLSTVTIALADEPEDPFETTEPRVRFESPYWITTLSAEGHFKNNGEGTDFDFKDDLGVEDEDFPTGRIIFRLGQNHRLRLEYARLAYEGDNVLERDITFRGEDFTVDTRVLTDLDIHYARLGWTWQFINLFERKFRLGTQVDIKGFDVSAELDAPEYDDLDESADITFGFPSLGLAMNVEPAQWLSFYAKGSGMSAGKYGWFADGEAGARITPFKNLSFIGGYRWLQFDLEDGDDFVDVRIDGPFIGASLNF